jgi:hypothetical protein
MISRNRFCSLAVTVLVASLVLAGGRARAATITHFEGQFFSDPTGTGTNFGISTNQPGEVYAGGMGEKIFYLSSGSVSDTQERSTQWILGSSLNNLTMNVSAFTETNPFGSVTAFGIPLDSTLLQVLTTGAAHADFSMADTAKITSKQEEHHVTIEIGVTLRPSSDPNGDDLSTFVAAGGGTFTIDIDNIIITQPPTDGQVFFPVGPGQVTVNWSINPVPEPSTAMSMLIGAGLLALWARRRTKPRDEG